LIGMLHYIINIILCVWFIFFFDPYSEISLHKPSLNSSICHQILTFFLFTRIGVVKVVFFEVAPSTSPLHSVVYKNYPHHLSSHSSDCNYQALAVVHSPDLPYTSPSMSCWPFHHRPSTLFSLADSLKDGQKNKSMRGGNLEEILGGPPNSCLHFIREGVN
jgi:hypothetical protein